MKIGTPLMQLSLGNYGWKHELKTRKAAKIFGL